MAASLSIFLQYKIIVLLHNQLSTTKPSQNFEDYYCSIIIIIIVIIVVTIDGQYSIVIAMEILLLQLGGKN